MGPATELPRLGIDGLLTVDPLDIETASIDFGLMTRDPPLAVLHPASADDVAKLIRTVANAAEEENGGFTVSARGHGHSINGQAQTGNGVVIEMSGGGRQHRRVGGRGVSPPLPVVSEKGRFVDVWGGELWIDVLKWTLEYGLAPRSWTDYLYLSVGGTLSNGGISGQAFNHGPQISNVHELDVVTGPLSFLLTNIMQILKINHRPQIICICVFSVALKFKHSLYGRFCLIRKYKINTFMFILV